MNDAKVIDRTYHFSRDPNHRPGEGYTQFVETWAARLLPDLPEFGQNWELTNEREGLILWLGVRSIEQHCEGAVTVGRRGKGGFAFAQVIGNDINAEAQRGTRVEAVLSLLDHVLEGLGPAAPCPAGICCPFGASGPIPK